MNASYAEFAVTFPAFIPMTPDETPEVVEVDGKLCLCLFTELRLFDQYRTGRRLPANGKKAVAVWSFNTPDALDEFLLANEAQFERQDCWHIAVNPCPETAPQYAPIHNFVEYLKSDA